jgi:hypothetical protein
MLAGMKPVVNINSRYVVVPHVSSWSAPTRPVLLIVAGPRTVEIRFETVGERDVAERELAAAVDAWWSKGAT